MALGYRLGADVGAAINDYASERYQFCICSDCFDLALCCANWHILCGRWHFLGRANSLGRTRCGSRSFGYLASQVGAVELVSNWFSRLLYHFKFCGAGSSFVGNGFDPSGYVKGWAADRVAQMLIASGCVHIQVNAAGDLTLRGGVSEKGVFGPWKIGVVNPDNRQEVLRIFEIKDGAIATSGTYERDAHIFDPATGTIAIGAKSATVLGPDGGLTDALATALMVAGEDGAGWFAQPELSQYSAWVIDRHSGGAWGVGPALLN